MSLVQNSRINSGITHTFRALRTRNYRLFFSGQSISLIGTWITRVATSWLVYRLTHSTFLLGIVGFSGQIPSFLLAPIGGIVADRFNRHRLLVVTQVLSMIQSFALAILMFTGLITVPYIIFLNIFQGLINAFDMPIRQSFMVEMIEDRKDLGNAIALNSSMVNAARLFGPSIAGVLISLTGEGMCFTVDGFSYLAVILSLLLMKIHPRKIKIQNKPVLHDLKSGFSYAFHFLPIRYILLLLALVSLMGVPYQVLMPVFAKDILHGDAHTLGFLMAAAGMGALTGALYLASRKTVLGLGKVIPMAAMIFGLGLIGFSLSKLFWLSMILLVFVGFGMMVQMASSNTILQTVVDEDKRGRVMSFYAMAFMGMSPFGSLLAGMLANRICTPETISIGGVCCIIGGLLFLKRLPLIREKARPIYVKMGIIPEVATGVQAATELTVPPEE